MLLDAVNDLPWEIESQSTAFYRGWRGTCHRVADLSMHV
jgi:hypothetical protein